MPYSRLISTSEATDLAAMDALCLYLTPSRGHLPRHWPTVPLQRPTASERAEAARRLDATGPLTPDQRLLRVLLNNDQQAFEHALVARLTENRQGLMADPAPRTLLPLGTLALTALAVQVHRWKPDVRSGHLAHPGADGWIAAGHRGEHGSPSWVTHGAGPFATVMLITHSPAHAGQLPLLRRDYACAPESPLSPSHSLSASAALPWLPPQTPPTRNPHRPRSRGS
ncbi:Imm49 family immunity protein [Streptomyces sp. UNOB3_S3]|uniref:Imm49 family immunity protein n=1 Tax=Streptomyces sp. UNOB3_S3 TaxID=2871682 RepID=UPI0035AEBC94